MTKKEPGESRRRPARPGKSGHCLQARPDKPGGEQDAVAGAGQHAGGFRSSQRANCLQAQPGYPKGGSDMVKIVTDSSCDLSLERCAELGVEMLPITVNFGEESYRANVDLTTEDFYDKLAQAKELPHTAQITPAFFEKKFKEYMEAGDQVVCLFISSQMSGTLQSATVAKGMLGGTNIYLPTL